MLTIAFFLTTARHPHYRRGFPLDRLDGVPRRGPQRLGRTLIYQGNDFLEVMVAGGKPSDGVYADATSVVGLAYLGWLSAISASLSRALVVRAHPSPPRNRVLICDGRYGDPDRERPGAGVRLRTPWTGAVARRGGHP